MAAPAAVRRKPMLLSCALSVSTWGGYGPTIAAAIKAFVTASPGLAKSPLGKGLMPLPGVGIGYLLSAVLVPTIIIGYLRRRGIDTGQDTRAGWIACFKAGLLGAIGALGVSIALAIGPGASVVMPLVFCGAPLVNTIKSLWGKPLQSWNKWDRLRFFLGIACLIAEVVLVLFAKDMVERHNAAGDWGYWFVIPTLVTVVCWGLYGPKLHAGTALMSGSNPLVRSMRALRPVGVAYLVVASAVAVYLAVAEGGIVSDMSGMLWAVLGGVLGCAGALGISFGTYFGKGPVAVMPIVFGGSPLMNTVYTIALVYLATGGLPPLAAVGWLSLGVILGVAGVVCVLLYKPKLALAGH